MSILFEPLKLGKLEIKNRFVRSATYFALADEDGFIGRPSVELMKTLAEGGVGLIVTGYAYVLKSGQCFIDMNGIQSDEHIAGYRQMTQAVHEAGGRIVMQIVHGGAGAKTVSELGGDYMAVSLTDDLPDYGKKAKEMTGEDIQSIIQAFGRAARRVQEAGFDGVQIHGAHGYLVSQFLSPVSNRRDDEWGGSLENRMRFVLEVTRAMRKQVHPDFPLMIKLGCRDYYQDREGLTMAEGAEVARRLEEEGICLIEISHGYLDRFYRKKFLGITSPEKEAFLFEGTSMVREKTRGPLCLVGGMRSPEKIEEIIGSGVVDCVSLSRPLIREPALINRWRRGDTRPAECISCGKCFNPDERKKNHIFCSQLKKKK